MAKLWLKKCMYEYWERKKEKRKEETVGLTRKSNNLNDSLIILTSYIFTNFGHSQLRNQYIIHCSLTYNANVRNFSPFRKYVKKIWELMWSQVLQCMNNDIYSSCPLACVCKRGLLKQSMHIISFSRNTTPDKKYIWVIKNRWLRKINK